MLKPLLSRVFSSAANCIVNNHAASDMAEPTKRALSLLKSQCHLYAKVKVNGHMYTIARDDIMVCHRIKNTCVGDILELNEVKEIGSRDYTLKGGPDINPSFYSIKACVLENGRGAKVKAKEGTQRKGRRKNVTIKPHTTLLRVQNIDIVVPQ